MPAGRSFKGLLILFIILGLMPFVVSGQTSSAENKLQVKVEGLGSEKGVVQIALFNQEEGFPGNSSKAYKLVTRPAKGGEVQLSFGSLPPGRYAIAVLHDENSNGQLDTNMVGYPKEGYGASNNNLPLFRAPNFGEAAFEVGKSEQSLIIRLRN